MKKLMTAFVVLSSVVGCSSAPTRLDTGEFESLMSGTVPKDSVLEFASCVYDGFLRSHSMLTDIDTRQQVRNDGYRVETYAGGRMLLVSTDVLTNGHVELWESSAAALINTTGEREAFKVCLSQYGTDL
ncbi:hypothetical protein [Vibrio chagasii]|uniref:hypothetical protein n=1 Tax=Vibrio chagasii TaxID=170679 RepID=UPI002283AAF4|nr:hypothetical protein [Vibrio chagasii]MCY9827636.1 hypothetical protein [Vibrio chagasii]